MLIGRLGNAVEKRVIPSGASVATVSLATSERFKDKSGQMQERTEWHRVVLWNRLADLAEQYLNKGSQIYIEGSLRTNEWQDKDGNKRYTTEIQAQTMQFLDPKQDAGQRQGGGYQQQNAGGYQNNQMAPPANQQQAPSGPSFQPNDDFIEDDIPF